MSLAESMGLRDGDVSQVPTLGRRGHGYRPSDLVGMTSLRQLGLLDTASPERLVHLAELDEPREP